MNVHDTISEQMQILQILDIVFLEYGIFVVRMSIEVIIRLYY